MANTGHDFGSWGFVQKSGTGDWDDLGINDNASAYSAAISLDKKSACIIGMVIANSDVAVSGVVTIAILGDADGTNYEAIPGLAGAQVGNPMKFTVTPVQASTVYLQFSVSPRDYDNFKVAILNEGGGVLTTDVRIKTADVPVAS